jgi:2-polyprenyl-6-methoxyphenol hydroxylase-like FAD-dependent oxidoreductase
VQKVHEGVPSPDIVRYVCSATDEANGKEAEMHDVDVAIVGAGPTGLALASELRLAGISCRVLERRTDEPNITRAFAVHARTLELLDARGLADALLPRGVQVPGVQPVPGAFLNLGEVGSRYPFVLIVPQSGTERLLEERARELGAEIERGAEVVGLDQDESGVRLTLAGGRTMSAAYVVGADGAHSEVRRLVGVDFVGTQYETHIVLADVRLANPPENTLFARNSPEGLVLVVPFGDGWFRAIVWDRARERVPLDEPVTLAELRDAFVRIGGTDFGMGEPRWRSRFLSERRQAREYRVGRVFLAGDAAHVHSPIGGQGMNTGIQDAMNLGWKLGAAVRGWAGPGLLDTYQRERHPVGASVLAMTDALYKLVVSSSRFGMAVRRQLIRAALRFGPVRRELAGRLTGIGIHYEAPRGAHPWIGRRMPDLQAGGQRVYEALRSGRFLFLGEGDIAGWAGRVDTVRADHPGKLPAAVLVRPDGYVAWASDRPDPDGVRTALREWCGPVAALR